MKEKMVCPRCGFEQPSGDSCLKCGIVISKFTKITATKQERDKIEASLEKSLERYFTTSAKEDELEALAHFKQTKKRYLLLLGAAFLLSLTGLALINYSDSMIGFYIGLGLVPGGAIAGLVCVYIVYRCPVCGVFLWLHPDVLGVPGSTPVPIWPPPSACPNCSQPLK